MVVSWISLEDGGSQKSNIWCCQDNVSDIVKEGGVQRLFDGDLIVQVDHAFGFGGIFKAHGMLIIVLVYFLK